MCELFLRYSDDAVPKCLLSTELQVVLGCQIFKKRICCCWYFTQFTNISDRLYTNTFSFCCQNISTLGYTHCCGKCVPQISVFIDNFDILSIEMPLFVFAPKAPFFLNTMTFVLSVFMWRKRSLQAELSTSSWFWRPLGVSDMRTISSAKSRRNISTNPGSSWIPCIPGCSTDNAISLINKEKSMGLSMQPCLSPAGQSKNSVSLSPILTHDTTDLYTAPRAFKNFPDSPFWQIMWKSGPRWTESNVFFRSTKHVYII